MVIPAPLAAASFFSSSKHYWNRIPLLLLIFFICLPAIFFRTNGIDTKRLGFAPDSNFKIAVFADLHYGENAWTDWGPLQDQRSSGVMSTVLNSENPDFVIYLGDVLTANNLSVRNASKYWEHAISPTRSKNLPWASVFGNHDDMAFEWPPEWVGSLGVPNIQCPQSSFATGGEEMAECYFQRTTRAELIERELQEDLSYTSYGPKAIWPSVSNYVLEILQSPPPSKI